MHMVGELLAHKIINMLTKIGIIRNYIHFRNPSVSKGTKTEKRLRKMGITTEKARVNALTHLSQSLGLTTRQFRLCDTVCTLALARGPFTNGFRAFDKLFYYRNSIRSYRGHTEIARMFARRSFISTKRSQSLLGCGLPTFHVVFQESNIKRVEMGDKLQ